MANVKNSPGRDKYIIAIEYLKGINREVNLEKAYQLTLEAANEGFPYAINSLGAFYLNGMHVASNIDSAIKYFLNAYHLGNPKAAFNLCYLKQKGIEHIDLVESKDGYFSKAVEFALNDLQRGENIALDFLIEDIGATKERIDYLLKKHILSHPICSICDEYIIEKNKPFKDIIRFGDLGNLNSLGKQDVIIALKADPIVTKGLSCYPCFVKYVQPMRELFFDGFISRTHLDDIMNESLNSIENRLELLKNAIFLYNMKKIYDKKKPGSI